MPVLRASPHLWLARALHHTAGPPAPGTVTEVSLGSPPRGGDLRSSAIGPPVFKGELHPSALGWTDGRMDRRMMQVVFPILVSR